MKYLSLFAGIGGLDLAMDRLGGECVLQVEIDGFCQSVLAARWPDVPKAADVRDVGAMDDLDFIVGGFPCQPVSVAGRKLGLDDPRWLWPQFARIIREARPRAVFIENVPGLHHRGLEDVLHDLSALGYGGAWDFVSAWDAGAPHLRKRLWVLALRGRSGFEGRTRTGQPPPRPTSSTISSGQNVLWLEPGVEPIILDEDLWPSPKASAAHYGRPRPNDRGDLQARVLWPSPNAVGRPNEGNVRLLRARVLSGEMTEEEAACTGGPGTSPNRRGGLDLRTHVSRWPTPSGRDYKDVGDSILAGTVPVNGLLGRAVGPSLEGGGLNPDWVEWLMGFPVGWTVPSLTRADLRAHGWATEPSLPRVARGVSQRRQRLTALGNAVVPDAAVWALHHLAARLNLDTADPQWFTSAVGVSRHDGKGRHKMAEKTRIDLAQHAIAGIVGKEASVKGGGSGWTAGVNSGIGEIVRKSTTKVGALEAVLAELQKATGLTAPGPNLCKCGCGGTTKRNFVPGHDARFHLAEAARKAGFANVDEYRAHLKVERDQRAAARRRAKRAAVKVGAAKVEAAAKAGTLSPKPAKPRKAPAGATARALGL